MMADVSILTLWSIVILMYFIQGRCSTNDKSAFKFKNMCTKINVDADLHNKILDAPPLGQIFFIFMQFLRKFGRIIGWYPLWDYRPFWETLDHDDLSQNQRIVSKYVMVNLWKIESLFPAISELM